MSSAYALVTRCEARHAVGMISWLKTAGGVVHVIREIVIVIVILLLIVTIHETLRPQYGGHQCCEWNGCRLGSLHRCRNT